MRQYVLEQVKQDAFVLSRMRCEYALPTSNEVLRADVVHFDGQGQARWIIECKAFSCRLTQTDLGQLARYMRLAKVVIGLLTNGYHHVMIHPNGVDELPSMDECINRLKA